MVSIRFRVLHDQLKASYQDGVKSGIRSGNAGDIIYSLPTVKALGIRHLILNVYRSPDPLRLLSEETAFGLLPLLLFQDYIDRVTIVFAGVPLERLDPACIEVDFNLDQFRNQDTHRLHLMVAHARAQAAHIDPNVAFLSVPYSAEETVAPEVVMAFTPRHRLLSDDYIRALIIHLGFKEPLLLTVPEEWRSVSGIPGRVIRCKDMFEMACIINSSPIFIGSPGLASAIAEGLKVPRLVDLQVDANAFPVGPRGYAIPNQIQELSSMLQHIQRSRAASHPH